MKQGLFKEEREAEKETESLQDACLRCHDWGRSHPEIFHHKQGGFEQGAQVSGSESESWKMGSDVLSGFIQSPNL